MGSLPNVGFNDLSSVDDYMTQNTAAGGFGLPDATAS